MSDDHAMFKACLPRGKVATSNYVVADVKPKSYHESLRVDHATDLEA